MQTKEPAEAKDQGPSPVTADLEAAIPEKAEGPARASVQRAPAAGAMPPARAAEMLAGPEPAAGAPGQARLMRSMQQSVGNARVGRVAQANASGPAVQRQPQDTRAAPPLEQVQSVRSLHVEENLAGAVTGANSALERRLAQRKAAIERDLAAVSKLQGQPWAKKKADALTADLEKGLDEILKSADSQYVNPKLRKDVVDAHKAVEKKESARKAGEEQWRRYDPIFADQGVVKILAAKSFTVAELKALVAQESGDLTRSDVAGDKAGIAQMGAQEAKEVGGKPEDRLVPSAAIPLAARALIKKAAQLEAGLVATPQGADYKKFVFASYNAGAQSIIEAQKKARAMGRDPTSWESLVKGGVASPLYHGIKIALPKLDTAEKYQETSGYVAKIFVRLE
jgi:hypothetical protein